MVLVTILVAGYCDLSCNSVPVRMTHCHRTPASAKICPHPAPEADLTASHAFHFDLAIAGPFGPVPVAQALTEPGSVIPSRIEPSPPLRLRLPLRI